jgi:hypothetical protein
MKQFYILAATFVLAAFLFSCKQNTKQKENKVENTTSVIPAAEKAISIELKGILRTRRSYSNIQFMDDEKEIDAYLAKQGKSNPELYLPLNKEDSMWVERFERLGLIRGYGFLLHKFKKETKEVINFTDVSGKKVTIKFYNDDSSRTHFKAFCAKDSIDINTRAISLQNLDYAFLDIFPGGNKEFVFLNDYYVMNGDNFDFQVYEIKTN